MKKILIALLTAISIVCASSIDSDNIKVRVGGGMSLGFDGLGSGSDILFDFKVEPGIDIDIFRVGLDFELNAGWIFVTNQKPKSSYYFSTDYEESLSVVTANTKIGITGYIQNDDIGLLLEPYIVIPLGIGDELAKYTDENYETSVQMGYGIRGGIRFFNYNQITIGYEKGCEKPYNKETNKFLISYNILWQSSEKHSSYSSSYSSTYTPSYYSTYSDTSTYYSSYSDTTSYYSSDRVYVKGHYRHNKNGTVSWVRPHTRSYPGTKTYGGRRRR